MLRRKELTLLDPQNWDDRNDRYFMALYKEHCKMESMYAACFTQSKETYHHWRVFSGANHGACIEIRKPEFEVLIDGSPGFRKGEVEYLKIDEIEKLGPKDIERLPFLKRWGFEPEEEYRVMTMSDQPQAPVSGLPIDLAIIKRIYINPWIPDSHFHSIKATLEEIEDCGHIEITRSRLIDFQRWKNAGNRIAGKPKPKPLVFKPKTPAPFVVKPKPKQKSAKILTLKRPSGKKK